MKGPSDAGFAALQAHEAVLLVGHQPAVGATQTLFRRTADCR